MMDNNPYILEETDDYAVVYKPRCMHSTRKVENDNNLYDWYKEKSYNVFDIMHRLDYETQGLVLFARNGKAYNFFKNLQDNGDFIKEYSAICVRADKKQEQGFPPCPPVSDLLLSKFQADGIKHADENIIIESFFRPFGPGRKQVRPVIEDGKKHKETAKDKGSFYRTYITGISANEWYQYCKASPAPSAYGVFCGKPQGIEPFGSSFARSCPCKHGHDLASFVNKPPGTGVIDDVKISTGSGIENYFFTVQIKRGFRHQIRCHLAWIGFPIKGDPLYSQSRHESLALCSHALFFTDPSGGQNREYRIDL
jgi:hypothetical protein